MRSTPRGRDECLPSAAAALGSGVAVTTVSQGTHLCDKVMPSFLQILHGDGLEETGAILGQWEPIISFCLQVVCFKTWSFLSSETTQAHPDPISGRRTDRTECGTPAPLLSLGLLSRRLWAGTLTTDCT